MTAAEGADDRRQRDRADVVETLREALAAHETEVRLEAALALARLGEPDGRSVLLEVLGDPDGDPVLRGSALEGIALLGDDALVEPVRAVLEDPAVARQAAAALVALRAHAAIPELLALLANHPEPAVRAGAAATLGQLERRRDPDDLTRPVLQNETGPPRVLI